jgi:parallel beta-helix repeat protein
VSDILAASDPYIVRSGTTYRFMPLGGCGTLANCTASATPIQTAINFANAGETITVEAGTFVEQLSITKSLTLIGAGAGLSVIQSPSVLAVDTYGARDIVFINGGGVSVDLSGFTITGPGPAGGDFINYGIFVAGGATANIHDNIISAVRDPIFSGSQHGVGIQVGRNAYSTTGTATITNNVIVDYQKNGITVDGSGSSATIKGNTVTGAGPTGVIAQNGIQISRGASAILDGNTVSGNVYSPGTTSSTGVMLFQSGNVQVLNNNLSQNDLNLYSYSTGSVEITGNTITQAIFDGIWLEGTPTSTKIIDNVFSGNPEGLGVGDGFNNSALTVRGNSFVGNSTAVRNYTTVGNDVIAYGNWWGCPAGPSSPVCDQISKYVLVDPCLRADPFAKTISSPAVEPPLGELIRHTRVNPFVSSIGQVIPVTGGATTELSCASSSTRLVLNGKVLTFDGLCGYSVVAEEVLEAGLPAKFPGDEGFASGIAFSLLKNGQLINGFPGGALVQIAYPIPAGFEGKSLVILFWDGAKWAEVASSISGGYVVINTANPGTFVLAAR